MKICSHCSNRGFFRLGATGQERLQCPMCHPRERVRRPLVSIHEPVRHRKNDHWKTFAVVNKQRLEDGVCIDCGNPNIETRRHCKECNDRRNVNRSRKATI